VRVAQAGEDLALLVEALQDLLRVHPRPDQLDRDLLVVLLVVAHRQVDAAGLALAELAQ
jgi:hypothetical protein